jgi:hypothetical protein
VDHLNLHYKVVPEAGVNFMTVVSPRITENPGVTNLVVTVRVRVTVNPNFRLSILNEPI